MLQLPPRDQPPRSPGTIVPASLHSVRSPRVAGPSVFRPALLHIRGSQYVAAAGPGPYCSGRVAGKSSFRGRSGAVSYCTTELGRPSPMRQPPRLLEPILSLDSAPPPQAIRARQSHRCLSICLHLAWLLNWSSHRLVRPVHIPLGILSLLSGETGLGCGEGRPL